MWDITNSDTVTAASSEESKEADQQQATKKRKTNDAASASTTIPTHQSMRALTGHIGAVTALVYPHPSSLYSGSMDHNLKRWDVETGACTATWFGRQAVMGVDFTLEANVLGTAHQDKCVRIWDPRQQEKEVMKLQLKSHRGWVSSVKFHPTNAHMLASTSYDQTVKIWDMRASLPLFTMQAHTDKVMTCDWMDESVAQRAHTAAATAIPCGDDRWRTRDSKLIL